MAKRKGSKKKRPQSGNLQDTLKAAVAGNSVLQENFYGDIDSSYKKPRVVAVRCKRDYPCPLYLFLDNSQDKEKLRYSFAFEIPCEIPSRDIVDYVPGIWWIGTDNSLDEEYFGKLIFEANGNYNGANESGFEVSPNERQKFLNEEELDRYISFYMKGDELDFSKSWNDFQDACANYKKLGYIMELAKNNELKQLLQTKKNIILQGAPGTGKTYKTAELALSILGVSDVDFSDHEAVMKKYNELLIDFDDDGNIKNNGQIGFVTFHQSMDYEDFVEGIKPKTKDGTVSYNIEDGIFKSISKLARSNLKKNYVLIIDEINRGNVSKIFGELISLLEADKRVGGDHPLSVTLPYSKESFSVPSNLYIIGTMNTTDRSVGSIDYAVRRRFAFVTLKADEDKATEGDARELFKAVRLFLKETKYDMDIEDLMVGHSYFMTSDTDALKMKWQYEILPLLMEYHKDGIIKQSPLSGFSEEEAKNAKSDYKLFIEKWPEKKSEEAEK